MDCTAAAHPLVLRPIIERFERAGHEVAVTAREYGQTLGILERLGLEYQRVGRHGGAGSAGKAAALARRSGALARWARRRDFDLATSSLREYEQRLNWGVSGAALNALLRSLL